MRINRLTSNMNRKSTSYRKPNLLVLLTFFVGFGVVATSVAQAAEPLDIMSNGKLAQKRADSRQWLPTSWSLDLADRIRNWTPKIGVHKGGDGLNLSQPFGVRGPALRLSKSLPDNVKRSLSAGGDRGIGAVSGDRPDAYLFLEKRW